MKLRLLGRDWGQGEVNIPPTALNMDLDFLIYKNQFKSLHISIVLLEKEK